MSEADVLIDWSRDAGSVWRIHNDALAALGVSLMRFDLEPGQETRREVQTCGQVYRDTLGPVAGFEPPDPVAAAHMADGLKQYRQVARIVCANTQQPLDVAALSDAMLAAGASVQAAFDEILTR